MVGTRFPFPPILLLPSPASLESTPLASRAFPCTLEIGARALLKEIQ